MASELVEESVSFILGNISPHTDRAAYLGDHVVQGPKLRYHKDQKGDINEQDTISMLLILTVYIPKGTFGEVITLPHVTKLGLTVNTIHF